MSLVNNPPFLTSWPFQEGEQWYYSLDRDREDALPVTMHSIEGELILWLRAGR